MRHTNREIEEAKMLSRRISASKNVSSPPLSRVIRATTLLLSASWTLLRMRARKFWMELLERTVCPHCCGVKYKLNFSHDADDVFRSACRLCNARGWIDWRGRENVRWGRALLDYRMERRHSQAFMQAATGVHHLLIHECEQGLVDLDDWPQPLYNIAEVHLGKTRTLH